MRWKDVQESFGLGAASRMLKRAGYRGTFSGIEIAAPVREPLSYCFADVDIAAGIQKAVRVEVPSGMTSEFPGSDCP